MMSQPSFRLYSWIKHNIGRAEHNLSSSGLSEPILEDMGVVTDYGAMRSEASEVEHVFKASVAELYGVRPENVLPTVGGTEAIYLVNLVLSTKVMGAYVPTPNYEPMFSVPFMLGFKLVKSPTLDGGVMVGLTDSNNPTGRLVSKEWMLKVLGGLGRHSYIYVDETFREFGFPEKIDTWFNLDPQRTIVSNTLTKFYGLGGLRAGWIIASGDIIEELEGLKPFITGENASYSMWIAAQAVKNRSRFVSRARRIVERNRKIVEEFVESNPKIRWSNPDGAPFCLVTYDGNLSSERLCVDALKEKHILIAPAEFFGAQNGFRLCFTHDDEDKLVGDLKALSDFLGEELG
jgi:aspartate/methionine/tyrosine aminotransferase